MRLTVAQLREAAIIGGASLVAFASMSVTYLIGHGSPVTPGVISAIIFGLWIFLFRRYGPRPQSTVDPRRQRIRFLSGIAAGGAFIAAGGALAAFALITALWIRGVYAELGLPCPARPWTDTAASNALSITDEEKTVDAAARCPQPS